MPPLFVLSRLSGFSLLLLWSLQPAILPAGESDCLRLTQLDIIDTEILTSAQRREFQNLFADRCISPELLREILLELSEFYLRRGYVTTRPYFEEQDVSDGQVEIQVLVGRIEAIIDAGTGAPTSRTRSAFAFHNEILNLRELESSLEMIERIPSVSAEIEIRPGTAQGSSVVAIDMSESDRLRLEMGVNAQTNLDPQISLRASLDNPLQINDIIEVRHNSGDVRKSQQSNRSQELDYSFSFDDWLFSLGYSDIEFDQRIQGINESLLSEGESETVRVDVSKIVARSQTGLYRLIFGLERKDSKSFFEDQLVDVSSYITSQAYLELQHTWLQPWGQLFTRYAYREGLDDFGARDDDYFTLEDGSDSEARLQFGKFVFDSNLVYYLSQSDWYLSSQLFLQYSDDILFVNDHLNLGSPYTVRGYSSALSGSNGGFLRVDLSRRLQTLAGDPDGPRLVKSMTISFGFDYGEIKCEIDNPDTCGEIYGVGLNLDIADDNFRGRLHWGHPLREIDDDIGDEEQFMLDLRWLL